MGAEWGQFLGGMKDEKLPTALEALLAGSMEGVSDEAMAEFLEMMESGPGEGASEEEVEAFMDGVMATEAGEKIVAGLSKKVSREVEDEVVVSRAKSPARLVLKVELLGTKPVIWRRVSLAADATFLELHGVIQDSFGWLNTGGHGFEVREGGRVEVRVSRKPEGRDHYGEAEVALAEMISNGVMQFHYRYDFEEGWDHLVTVEGAGEVSENPAPQVLDGAGLGPPEGVGGVKGFREFLAGNHPMGQEYGPELVARIREGEFDPGAVRFRDAREFL